MNRYILILNTQLLLNNWHVIVVLSLEHVTSNRVTHLILDGKFANGKRPSASFFMVWYSRLLNGQFFWLLIDQENVPMKTSVLMRGWANVLDNYLALAEVTSRYVARHPHENFSILWIETTWIIQICFIGKW